MELPTWHFLSLLPDVTGMSIKTVFSPHMARFWNSLSVESIPLTYDLNAIESRINRELLSVGCHKEIFCML